LRATGSRLLLVEDDQAIQEVMQLILVEEGYQVEIAERPEVAAELLRHSRYDLVLTDLFGGNPATGLAAVRPVLEAASPTPVGVCTGFALSSAVASAAGFAFMVPKPFELDTLLEEIAEALAEAASWDEADIASISRLRLPDTGVAL
jgi:DNA-binding NtrC family response regulator